MHIVKSPSEIPLRYIAHPGGAVRHESIAAAAREHGITVFETGVRCFFH